MISVAESSSENEIEKCEAHNVRGTFFFYKRTFYRKKYNKIKLNRLKN